MELERERERERVKRSNKRKLQAVVALALILALMSAGTLAWTSFSQYALNETRGSGNPGGRLHDDFDGGNKDIYVENYGAVPIYARIQLTEYMETGKNAGKYAEGLRPTDGAGITIIGDQDADIYDRDTWEIWIPNQNATADFHKTGTNAEMPKYFDWVMGGEKVFMPTFDKDWDSDRTDLGGSQGWVMGSQDQEYRVNDPEDQVYTSGTGEEVGTYNKNNPQGSHDYWTVGDKKTDTEHYNIEEHPDTKAGVEHVAKPTLSAEIMTMSTWMTKGSPLGNFWVIDEDGWAYWASPIEPGTATGLLLSEIKIQKDNMPKDDWYYAIDAEAQFATADDLDYFFEDDISDNARKLLEKAEASKISASGIRIEGPMPGLTQSLKEGDSIILTAKAQTDGSQGSTQVDWSIAPASSDTTLSAAATSATVTNVKGTPGDLYKKITVTATSKPELQGTPKSASIDVWIIKATDTGVVIGKDGKAYLDYGDGTYAELKGDGTLGVMKEAGFDGKIGTGDDNDVIQLEGKKYVKVGEGQYISPKTGDPNAKFRDTDHEIWWIADGSDKTPTQQSDLTQTKPAGSGGTPQAGVVKTVAITDADGLAVDPPMTINKGATKAFTFTPIGMNDQPLSGDDAKMTYNVQGFKFNSDNDPTFVDLKNGTSVDANGKLTVATNETAPYIVLWYKNADGVENGLLFEVTNKLTVPAAGAEAANAVKIVSATKASTIPGSRVGDTADWIPIATKKVDGKDYYLITRTELIKLDSRGEKATRFGSRFGLGLSMEELATFDLIKKPYTYFDDSSAIMNNRNHTSDVYRLVNSYYNGSGTGLLKDTYTGDVIPAKLKKYVVGNDATDKIGEYADINASSGYSSPVPSQTGSSASAFVLSFQEAASFLSIENQRTVPLTVFPPRPEHVESQRSSSAAKNNFNLFKDYGDVKEKGCWLRSPGQIESLLSGLTLGYLDSSLTSTLDRDGEVVGKENGESKMIGIGLTNDIQLQLNWGKNTFGVRPALWVSSDIFNA